MEQNASVIDWDRTHIENHEAPTGTNGFSGVFGARSVRVYVDFFELFCVDEGGKLEGNSGVWVELGLMWYHVELLGGT